MSTRRARVNLAAVRTGNYVPPTGHLGGIMDVSTTSTAGSRRRSPTWRALVLATATALAGAVTSSAAAAPMAGMQARMQAAVADGACSAQAHVDGQWGAGQPWAGGVLSVTVHNTSAAALNGWSASWALAAGQKITGQWGATVTLTGAAVSAANLPYNGAVAPGGAVTFGVQLSGTVPATAPAVSCTTGGPAGSDRVTQYVSDADDTQTVVLRVGDTLVGSFVASDVPPTVSSDVITPVSITGGYPTRQPLLATYRGAAIGTADLTTYADNDCNHAPTPCTLPPLLITIHVKVIAADSPVPKQTRQVLASLSTSGSTVPLHVGDTLYVMIPDSYRQPTTAGPVLVLREPATGGYPTGSIMRAYYTAVAPGQQDVQSITDYDCLHTEPLCARPQQQWIVHVSVTP